jgi:endonuclease VIII
MEGPSLFLAAQQLAPFKSKVIAGVTGNTKIGKERLAGQRVKDIFSWGKHLVFQFDDFALRVHFLLFGSFEATVDGKSVTGDYKKRARVPRLAFVFENGHLEMYSCSVRYLETANAKKTYDFSISIMNRAWEPNKALKALRQHRKELIADALLDQTLFAGVGNIIKNEVLFLAKTKPTTPVDDLPLAKRKEIVALAKTYSHQFYRWRKKFVLKKHYRIYRKPRCPICGQKVIWKRIGRWQRWSFYCPLDQAY